MANSKYTPELVEKICDLISKDDYTIAEICKNVGISEGLFYNWKRDYADFIDAIKRADEKRLEFFKVEARKAILKKIQGYDYQEIHITKFPKKESGGRIITKEKKIIKKHVPPDSVLLMYILNNTDPENFKHKEHMEHTVDKIFVNMTEEDKQDLVKRIKNEAE